MTARTPPSIPAHRHTVLVLQGGGALGAYQAGVYEELHERGLAPDWVTGVSIGAINAALIAGNRPENRVAQLRRFWELVSSGMSFVPPHALDPLRRAFSRLSTTAIATFGVPGFFVPRVPSPVLIPRGAEAALSVYDTSPLARTLAELVDFDLINAGAMRLSVGAVDVQSGNSVYFDNADGRTRIGPQHVMASGALPPGFPPVQIGDAWYWDGGLASNSPLWYVLDDGSDLNALVFQIDLFSARGSMPQSLDEVLERSKDIQYSSKTRFNTNRAKDDEALREAMRRVIEMLPARLREDPSARLLARRAQGRKISIVHLINRRSDFATVAKDFDFSRATIEALWDAGRADLRRTLAHPHWQHAAIARDGLRTYDLLP
ncbi:MAG TPA: patatin-like phospholipase family protein [Casimicrobiaceae bacterium]|nr:patatin-like phospholipase family protein [Casimicrobiaceae bacterium]